MKSSYIIESITIYYKEPLVGLEPTIYRLEVCRVIHCATGASSFMPLRAEGFAIRGWVR